MFFERVTELCQKKGISLSAAAKEIGLSNSAITYWKRGAVPKASTVQKLADYFGVTTDYLLGKENLHSVELFPNPGGPIHTSYPISDEDIKFAFFGGADEITDEMLDEVKRFAAYIKQRESDKKKKNPPQD